MNEGWGYFLVGAFLAWCIWHAPAQNTQTATSYLLTCDDAGLENGACQTGWHHRAVIVYAVFPQQQLVVERWSVAGIMISYHGCTVFDAENWSCSDANATRTVQCRNGDCMDSTDFNTNLRVGAIRYYWAWLSDLFHPSAYA